MSTPIGFPQRSVTTKCLPGTTINDCEQYHKKIKSKAPKIIIPIIKENYIFSKLEMRHKIVCGLPVIYTPNVKDPPIWGCTWIAIDDIALKIDQAPADVANILVNILYREDAKTFYMLSVDVWRYRNTIKNFPEIDSRGGFITHEQLVEVLESDRWPWRDTELDIDAFQALPLPYTQLRFVTDIDDYCDIILQYEPLEEENYSTAWAIRSQFFAKFNNDFS